jgi:uncharacterized protein (TIGR03437 family)
VAPSALRLGIALLLTQPVAPAGTLELTPRTATGAPGSSLFFSIGLAAGAAAPATLQFDLQYDGSVMSVIPLLGGAARETGKGLYSADLPPDTRRFVITGLNRNPVHGGNLLGLIVNIGREARVGVYPLILFHAVGADRDGRMVSLEVQDGAVVVEGGAGPGGPIHPAGVVSAASFVPGPVAPGAVITLFGSAIGPALAREPSPASSSSVLGGTSVLFDGAVAPLLYAGPDQINAVVPYSVAGRQSALMRVEREGQTVAELRVDVARSAPAIFALGASGSGQGAILNQDASVNSHLNPAPRGSIAVLYATGAGEVDPPGVDGAVVGTPLPEPVLPVSVWVGGLEAEVEYAGGAPQLISGVLQVNFRVPAGAPVGPAVPVSLTVGAVTSPPGVSMAIR